MTFSQSVMPETWRAIAAEQAIAADLADEIAARGASVAVEQLTRIAEDERIQAAANATTAVEGARLDTRINGVVTSLAAAGQLLGATRLTRKAGSVGLTFVGGDGTTVTVDTDGTHPFVDGDTVAVVAVGYVETAANINVLSTTRFEYASTTNAVDVTEGYASTLVLHVEDVGDYRIGQRIGVTNDQDGYHRSRIADITGTTAGTIELEDAVPSSWLGASIASIGNDVSTPTEEVALADTMLSHIGDRTLPDIIGTLGGYGNVHNLRALGGIGDGTSHPLSDFYPTLAAAQVDYPEADALDVEIDTAAFLRALYLAKNGTYGGMVYIPIGHWWINRLLQAAQPSLQKSLYIVGEGLGSVLHNYSSTGCLRVGDTTLAANTYNAFVDNFAIENQVDVIDDAIMEFSYVVWSWKPSRLHIRGNDLGEYNTLRDSLYIRTITSISTNGTVVTVVTSAAHGFVTGDVVTITGTTNFNDSATAPITYLTTTSFSYPLVLVAATETSGTVVNAKTAIANVEGNGTVIEVTTKGPHGRETGDRLSIVHTAGYDIGDSGPITVLDAYTMTFESDVSGSPESIGYAVWRGIRADCGLRIVNCWCANVDTIYIRNFNGDNGIGLEIINFDGSGTGGPDPAMGNMQFNTIWLSRCRTGVKISRPVSHFQQLFTFINLKYHNTELGGTLVNWSYAESGRTITSIVGNGTTVTVTVNTAHGYISGDDVLISDTTAFDGEVTSITVTGATTFTYSSSVVASEITGQTNKREYMHLNKRGFFLHQADQVTIIGSHMEGTHFQEGIRVESSSGFGHGLTILGTYFGESNIGRYGVHFASTSTGHHNFSMTNCHLSSWDTGVYADNTDVDCRHFDLSKNYWRLVNFNVRMPNQKWRTMIAPIYGASTLNGTTGRVITHNLATTEYRVAVNMTTTYAAGKLRWVRAANDVTIYSDTADTGAFEYIILPLLEASVLA